MSEIDYLKKIHNTISEAKQEIVTALEDKGYYIWITSFSICSLSVTIKGHFEDIDIGFTDKLSVVLTRDIITMTDITTVSCQLRYIDDMVKWAYDISDNKLYTFSRKDGKIYE